MWLKQKLAWVLIVLMSINSFGAAVSDNDGSAFITKAEFDSLKNDFVQQLNEFNSNIDSKLNNAISEYLSGVKVGSTTTEVSNVSGLSWPIKVIDKLKVIEEMNVDNDKAEREPLWNLSLDIWGAQMRGGYWLYDNTALDHYSREATYTLSLDRLKPPHYDKIEYYLNGTRSGENFIVSNLCVKPILEESTGIIHENMPYFGWNEVESKNQIGVFSVFLMDANSMSNPCTYASGVFTRSTVRQNYSALWSTNNWNFNTAPKLFRDHFADRGTQKSPKTTADKYDYYVGTYIHPYYFSEDDGQALWSGRYTYTNQNLDRIYNYADTTNNSHFAPVTYNNILYFTNKKWNRFGVKPISTISWLYRNPSHSDRGVLWLTTPGENLENEYENRAAGRAWYNKALISTNRLYVSYVLPTGTTRQHRMAYGIPVFYVSKDAKDVKLTINFTSSTGKSSNKKYLIASKNAISTQRYSDNVETNTNYISLKKGTVRARKLELSEGTNEIDIGELNQGDTLFIKLLWNDTNDEMITLNRPQIKWTIK